MGKNYRIGGHFSGDPNLHGAYAKLQHHDAKCMQIFIGDQHGFFPWPFSKAQQAAYKQLKLDNDIKLAAHGSYIVNIAYDGEERNKYDLGIKSIVSQLKMADALGADFLVMHVGSHKEQGVEQGIDNLVRATSTILEQTEGIGTTLLFENTAGGGTQIGHLQHLHKALLKINSSRTGLCIDTTHAFADGLQMDDRATRRAVWDSYGDKCLWLHYNNPDPKVNLGSHLDRHQEPWLQAKWPVDVMLEIADEMGPHVPLCMEAGREGAYDVNFMLLDEAGML